MPYKQVGLNSLVDYIKRMLDDKKIERIVLGGNSLGGHVALKLALTYPDRVAGLVLVGSSGLFNRTNHKTPHHPSREWVREKMKEVFFDEAHITEVLVRKVHETISSPEQARKVVRMARSAKHDNLREELSHLSCPVMLIWGADDQITPLGMAFEFKRCLPHAEMELIEQCGHAPNIERPREVARIMGRFLIGHCSPQSANGDKAVRRWTAKFLHTQKQPSKTHTSGKPGLSIVCE
jgi:pimeloyl-ACP methyl ester carboxylesterase